MTPHRKRPANRVAALAARREALLDLSARHRAQLQQELLAAQPALEKADRAIEFIRQASRFMPLVLGTGVFLLAWRRPRAALSGAGRGLATLWQWSAPLRPLVTPAIKSWILERIRRNTTAP